MSVPSDSHREGKDRTRWGDRLTLLALVIGGTVVVLSSQGVESPWWPPIAATAFAAAFVGCIADAFRTGTVTGRSRDFDRHQQPKWFLVTVLFYGAMGLYSAIVAGLMVAGI